MKTTTKSLQDQMIESPKALSEEYKNGYKNQYSSFTPRVLFLTPQPLWQKGINEVAPGGYLKFPIEQECSMEEIAITEVTDQFNEVIQNLPESVEYSLKVSRGAFWLECELRAIITPGKNAQSRIYMGIEYNKSMAGSENYWTTTYSDSSFRPMNPPKELTTPASKFLWLFAKAYEAKSLSEIKWKPTW